jgi:predicted nucleic acid binding AN1-type Zn finger protein
VYNIPAIPKPDESGSTPAADAKPAMTANPTQCPSAALKIVGECPHCQKAFCGNHRTPESHNW